MQQATDLSVVKEDVSVKPEPAKTNHNNFITRAFEEEFVVMPQSTLGFIITALLAFVDIKSQGNPEFPFVTHPQAIMVSITSLIMYGLASGAELVVSCACNNPTVVYVIIARLGRIVYLCIMVVSLSSMLYV
ncbi:hypothetical protein R6Q59_021876 [Mikania micrantha]